MISTSRHLFQSIHIILVSCCVLRALNLLNTSPVSGGFYTTWWPGHLVSGTVLPTSFPRDRHSLTVSVLPKHWLLIHLLHRDCGEPRSAGGQDKRLSPCRPVIIPCIFLFLAIPLSSHTLSKLRILESGSFLLFQPAYQAALVLCVPHGVSLSQALLTTIPLCRCQIGR